MNESVETVVEKAPHVRVQVDPPDAAGNQRGLHPVDLDKGLGETVEHDVLQVEELAQGVADPAQGPRVQLLHGRKVELDGGEVEEVEQKVCRGEPEAEPRHVRNETRELAIIPRLVLLVHLQSNMREKPFENDLVILTPA